MEYHVLADGVFWTDENVVRTDWDLSNAFRLVLHHRTKIILGSEEGKDSMDCKGAFELAKKHFPKWIGFKKERCSYNKELAERIRRIQRASAWKIDKTLKELDEIEEDDKTD